MIILLALRILETLAVSCKDMNGNDVDWFALVKPPKVTSTNYGQEFMYLDPNHLTAQLSSTLINQPGAISYTLSQLNSKAISSVFFK